MPVQVSLVAFHTRCLSNAAARDLLAASFPDGAEQEVDTRLQGLPFPEQLCLVQNPY